MFSNRNSESKQNREESSLSEVKKQVRGLEKSNIKIIIKKVYGPGVALRIQLQVRDPRASIDNPSSQL